jgi:hypothetical protein
MKDITSEHQIQKNLNEELKARLADSEKHVKQLTSVNENIEVKNRLQDAHIWWEYVWHEMKRRISPERVDPIHSKNVSLGLEMALIRQVLYNSLIRFTSVLNDIMS